MLDGEAGVRDHLQHLGETARLVDGLDDQYLGYFHRWRTIPAQPQPGHGRKGSVP